MIDIKRLLQIPLIQNTARMSVSNVVMYLLPLVVTPVLSRLYLPESFGEWGIFSGLVSITNIGLFLGLENTIVKASDRSEALHLCLLCLLVSLGFVCCMGGVFAMGQWLDVPFFTSFPAPRLLLFYTVIFALYTILYNVNNRCDRYTTLAITHVVQGGGQALFRIIFGLLCITGINGLILGTTLAQCVSLSFLIVSLWPLIRQFSWQEILWPRLSRLLSDYRGFMVFDAPSSVLAFAAFNLPILILSAYFQKAEIGCYSIVLQLLLMPMSFIGSAMGRVYYQQLSRHAGDTENMRVATRQVLKVVSVISVLPLLFLSCGGDQLIVLFLGEKWQTAGHVSLCLALWSFPTILTQPLIPLFRHLNRLRLLLMYNLLYFMAGIGTLWLLCQMTGNLYTVLVGYAIACFIVKSLLFVRILTLGKVSLLSLQPWVHVLWLLSVIILIIRLYHLL